MSKSNEVGNAKLHYNYNENHILPLLAPPDVIDELRTMDVRPDDIFICSYPKSGTHWMRETVQLILHDGDASKLTRKHRQIIMEVIDTTDLEFGYLPKGTPNFKLMSDEPSPRVFITHLRKEFLPQQIWKNRCQIIYVYRHPKDVSTSWFEFDFDIMNQLKLSHEGANSKDDPTFAGFEKYLKEKLLGESAYDAWFDHVLEYDSLRDDHNIMYVSYEEMKTNQKEVVGRVAEFIGRQNLSEPVIDNVVKNAELTTMKKHYEELQKKSNETNKIDIRIFIGKGTTGRWKDYFSVRQSEEFDEVYHSKMKDCSITKIYDI